MSASEFGIIVIKNGVLDREASGFAKGFKLGEEEFWKHRPYWNTFDTDRTRIIVDHSIPYWCYERKLIYRYNIGRKKWVNVVVEGVDVKAKQIDDNRYLSKFTYNGDKYVLLHGYDIDLKFFWTKRSKEIVRKFIMKYATGGK